MKKLIYLLLTLMVMLSFVACDNSTSPVNEVPTDNAVTPEVKKITVTFVYESEDGNPVTEEKEYDENEVINLNEIAAEKTDSVSSTYTVYKANQKVTNEFVSIRGDLIINYPYVIKIIKSEEKINKPEVEAE